MGEGSVHIVPLGCTAKVDAWLHRSNGGGGGGRGMWKRFWFSFGQSFPRVIAARLFMAENEVFLCMVCIVVFGVGPITPRLE